MLKRLDNYPINYYLLLVFDILRMIMFFKSLRFLSLFWIKLVDTSAILLYVNEGVLFVISNWNILDLIFNVFILILLDYYNIMIII